MGWDRCGRWSGVRAIALDLDGVVYQGGDALPGAAEAVAGFRARGARVYFVTNNSARSRGEIARKLCAMGTEAGQADVLNAAYAAGVLIRELNSGRPAAVKAIGGGGLEAELELAGHRPAAGNRAEYLAVGLDTGFGYGRIAEGLEALLGGAVLVACNRDANYPAEGGRLLPGCGAMVSALEAASPAMEQLTPRILRAGMVGPHGKSARRGEGRRARRVVRCGMWGEREGAGLRAMASGKAGCVNRSGR